MPDLRLSTTSDLVAINDIYNHFVLTCTTTYDLEPLSMADRRTWFDSRSPQHPVVVVEQDNGVVAFGALSPFRAKPGYRHTVENSIYVHPAHQGKGIGRLILADQIERASALGHHTIIAVVDAYQQGSLTLHRKQGFEEVGELKQVGRKFDRWLDAVIMQKLL